MTENHSIRAGTYGRNSKPPKGWKPDFQGQEPPGSWRTQLTRCEARAHADGCEVAMRESDMATGGDPNRPGWDRVMAAVRGHRVQRVYVQKLDRVMRGARHFLEMAEEFEKAGAQLLFLDQPGANVVKGDPSSKAFRGMLAVWAEFELDLIRERSADVFEVGEDGRLYGPRSERPAGRPVEFGPEHKFRVRADGSREHVKARCRACQGVGKTGVDLAEGEVAQIGGVGDSVGFPTRGATNQDAGKMPVETQRREAKDIHRGQDILPSGSGGP